LYRKGKVASSVPSGASPSLDVLATLLHLPRFQITFTGYHEMVDLPFKRNRQFLRETVGLKAFSGCL